MNNVVSYPRSNKWLSQAWSQVEATCIERVMHRLREAGVVVEIEQGQTERGDPWVAGMSEHDDEYVIAFSKVGTTVVVHTHGGRKLVYEGSCEDNLCEAALVNVGTVVLAWGT